jgi:cytochrome c biogenesis protein CcmG/thiol:disulfide interchange protein DsbE
MDPAHPPGDDETVSVGNAERSRKGTRRALVFLPGVLLAGLLAYGLFAPARDKAADDKPSATSFDLPLLSGSGSVASADLRGKPVVLNFWASWCIPCKEEMPAFEDVWKQYRDRVTIVGVNVQDSPVAAKEFAETVGVTYPLVTDPGDELSNDLHVVGLPQTFFLDSELNLTGNDRQLGAISADKLAARIEKLIEEIP